LLAAGTGDRGILIFDLQNILDRAAHAQANTTPEPFLAFSLDGPGTTEVSRLAFVNEDKQLLSCSSEGVYLWKLVSRQSVPLSNQPCNDLTVNNSFSAWILDGRDIVLMDPTATKVKAKLQLPGALRIAADSQGKFLSVSESEHNTITVFDPSTSARLVQPHFRWVSTSLR
jgi:hypothetical protein